MTKSTVFRRGGVVISGAAIATAVLVGCQSKTESPPERQGSPATTTLNPMGPNSYTPSVKAPAPQTALPGNVVTGG